MTELQGWQMARLREVARGLHKALLQDRPELRAELARVAIVLLQGFVREPPARPDTAAVAREADEADEADEAASSDAAPDVPDPEREGRRGEADLYLTRVERDTLLLLLEELAVMRARCQSHLRRKLLVVTRPTVATALDDLDRALGRVQRLNGLRGFRPDLVRVATQFRDAWADWHAQHSSDPPSP